MKRGIRLIALSTAIAVNAAALFAAHVAMVDGAERERLPQESHRPRGALSITPEAGPRTPAA